MQNIRPLRSVSSRPDGVLARHLLELIDQQPDGAVILLAATVGVSGGYGLVSVDPLGSLTVRMFGWPRLTPGHAAACHTSVATLAANGFVFNGRDWIWSRPYRSVLVPVAAYAAQRALVDGWLMIGDDIERLVRPELLDTGDLALLAAGLVCDRCMTDCCTHLLDGSGSDGC